MILCKCLSGPWDASVLQLGLLLLALAVVALELVGGLLGDELDEVGKVPAAAVLLGFLERHKTKSINGLFLAFLLAIGKLNLIGVFGVELGKHTKEMPELDLWNQT